MKAAIIYYSLDGNTDFAAKKIAEKTGADVLRIDALEKYPTDKKKYMKGGMHATFGIKPKIENYAFDIGKYDTIIIGTPVWAGKMAPPIKTFLSDNDISGKKIAYFACSAGGNSAKCLESLKKFGEPVAVMSLIDPLNKKKASDDAEIDEFCKRLSC